MKCRAKDPPSTIKPSSEQIQAARWCPVCQSHTAVIHQRRIRRLRDLHTTLCEQIRFRCKRCGMTWTIQPDGIEPRQQRGRMLRNLGVIMYLAGFSGNAVAFLLRNLGIQIAPSTIYRDVEILRNQIGIHLWDRWRRTLQESFVSMRVLPVPRKSLSNSCDTLIFPLNQFALELIFVYSITLDLLPKLFSTNIGSVRLILNQIHRTSEGTLPEKPENTPSRPLEDPLPP